ncbi:polysaccharide deacetylase family protein [Streptomyces sp. ICN988]|uniref:polysaccharide deacetylase family protein n=1 Tax=Streptomyces sp. ICN988 TaxID=2983765 RepID=UPI0021E49A08|nr:polysaccharide deacetylase family protein [Streptomyces sp. ICN988]MCV2457893.1 polysaccharide deacetylase family protein [Streptomyces sp. ICN988]
MKPAVRRPSGRRLVLRAVVTLCTVAVVALPFAAAWQYTDFSRSVSRQADAPGVRSDANGAAASAPAEAPPVVLAYHDVAPGADSRYTVTPRRFGQQLTALRRAGYRTLSTEEFTRFLHTGHPPAPRSVYLTFDDGTHGLWVHADRILAAHGMKAAAYLITGSVGTHRPYYLSWPEIARMARSGRWDFQAHTRLSHRRAAIARDGSTAPVLSNRLWVERLGRLETVTEYRRRVAADLDRSIRDITDHGLPRPRLFAYPFSEPTARTNLGPDGARTLRELLRTRFTASLTNTSSRPRPAGPRAAAAGEVQRLEVTRDTTADGLLRELARWSAVRPSAVTAPLSRPDHWRTTTSPGRTGLGTLTGEGPYPPDARYAAAEYRPIATADWTHYRLHATVEGLREAVNGAGITVRSGSGHETALSVSRSRARLRERGPDGFRPAGVCSLTDAPEHEVVVRVTPGTVRVDIDGARCVTHRTEGRAPAENAGGFALNVRGEGTDGSWARFSSLKVGGAS